jgi:hypothetical protein
MTHRFEVMAHRFEVMAHRLEIMTRRFELAIRKIAFSGEKNYNLCYAKRIISIRILYA